MIEKAYNWVDDQIMKGVNASVRAYNWTTGRTKVDLADKLLLGATTLRITGWYTIGLIHGAVIGTVNFLQSYKDSSNNREFAALEENALQDGLLDERVELYKESSKTKAWIEKGTGSAIALMGMTSDHPKHDISIPCLVGGYFSSALSFYVIRADNLPPRKNCFSRGLDKISEYATAVKGALEPQPQPVPVPVQMSAREPCAPQALEARI